MLVNWKCELNFLDMAAWKPRLGRRQSTEKNEESEVISEMEKRGTMRRTHKMKCVHMAVSCYSSARRKL